MLTDLLIDGASNGRLDLTQFVGYPEFSDVHEKGYTECMHIQMSNGLQAGYIATCGTPKPDTSLWRDTISCDFRRTASSPSYYILLRSSFNPLRQVGCLSCDIRL
jgi:hypothetical protein